MASKALKGLPRNPMSWVKQLLSTVESYEFDDRTIVIVHTAAIERILERAIKGRFIRLSKSEQDRLFVGYSPLSSFSAKIRIGYALGIFGPDTRHDLEAIKDIRNAFAHSVKNVSFKTHAIVRKCKSLKLAQKNHTLSQLKRQQARQLFSETARVYHMLLALAGNPSSLRPMDPRKHGRSGDLSC